MNCYLGHYQSDKAVMISATGFDRHFASMLLRKAGIEDVELQRLFMTLSAQLRQQHTCLEITVSEALVKLRSCSAVTEVKIGGSLKRTESVSGGTPLVLLTVSDTQAYLYTQRFFAYETRIAIALIAKNQPLSNADGNVAALKTFFQPEDDPLQMLAATQAVTRRLSMITGGPGTGKTSTVVKILSALLKSQPDLRIKLAAPTGKAAMRLSESIRSAAEKLNTKVPSDVSTIHRLLGMRGDGSSFAYSAKRPLPLDVVILDEASMIDLVMFDRFMSALEPKTQLILLGDPLQLPSVDSGSVLADITDHGATITLDYGEELKRWTELGDGTEISSHPLSNSHCILKTSFRFKDDSGIGQLSKSLRTQNFDISWSESEDVRVSRDFDQTKVLDAMTKAYRQFLSACQHDDSAEALLEHFDEARLLTPIREGEFGVSQLNERFEQQHFPDAGTYYHGKPIMIERNHYSLRLFNGDIGICVQRGEKLEVAFRKVSGEIEYYLPSRLPQHDTCFAMTVHKSQGSEFDTVLLVLPEVQQDNFVNQELVYTGVTRCRNDLVIFTQQDLSSLKQVTRTSALALRLSALIERQDESALDDVQQPDGEIEPKTGRKDSKSQLDLF